MTDQQPENPAARPPGKTTPARIEPTRIDGPAPGAASHPDPTRIDRPDPAPASRPDPTRIDRPDSDQAAPASPTRPDPAPEPRSLPEMSDSSGAGAAAADETRAQGEPARWSGSAAVPPHVPKRPWYARSPKEGDAPPPADPWADSEDWSATPAVDPWADQDTPWQAELPFPEAMPPTRIDSPMPPTRMEAALPSPGAQARPPQAHPAAQPPALLPPAQAEALLRRAQAQARTTTPHPQPQARTVAPPPQPSTAPRQPTAGKSAAWPQATQPPAAQPPTAPAKTSGGRRGWGRRKPAAQQPPPNRLPVQTRPPVPQPQAKRPPPPPRRKRRWPRRLFLFTLFSAVCCGGVPAYLAWPAAQQYPVSAGFPVTVADLELRDDGAGQKAVERLSEQLTGTSLIQGDAFAAAYADGNGKRVTIFGTTGLRFTPESDVEAEIAHLTSEFDITEVQTFDLGETGVHERCGVGRQSGKAVVVCAWADHGSVATVLLTRRSVEESAELTGVLRSAVLTQG